MTEKNLIVRNRAGIHARPAAIISQTANRFESEILLIRDDISANAKSIMGVIAMGAGYNKQLTLQVTGLDESEAASTIEELFNSKFEEE